MAGYSVQVPRQESAQRTQRLVLGALARVLLYAVLLILSALFVLPLVWMLITSLKTDPQVYHVPLIWIPNPIRFENYPEAMTYLPFGRYFVNTVKYALLTSVGTLLSSSVCAYGFSRMQWKGRDSVFFLCLATMMIPFQVRMIPLYLVFNRLGWLNSYRPLVVPAFLGSAYDIFLLRQFFLSIPTELSDAARIDGCSETRILRSVILPLSRPALAVVGLFQLMNAWNDYLGPLVYLKDMTLYPIAMGLQQMRNQGMSAAIKLLWPRLMAASAITIAPILVMFFLTQRTFVEGISISGIKG
jgi:multiple sugar transport system permease protein